MTSRTNAQQSFLLKVVRHLDPWGDNNIGALEADLSVNPNGEHGIPVMRTERMIAAMSQGKRIRGGGQNKNGTEGKNSNKSEINWTSRTEKTKDTEVKVSR